MTETIASDQNPRFQLWRRVASSARERRQTGLVWLEGVRLVEEGLLHWSQRAAQDTAATLLVDSSQPQAWSQLQQRPALAGLQWPPVAALDPKLWARVSQVDQPQGLALVMSQPQARLGLAEGLAAACPWQDWVVLDGLQDPGNVGSLLRAAVGAGVSGAVLLKGTSEAFSPKALRAGMGAQFGLDIWEGVARETWLELSAQQGILPVLTLAPQAAQTVSLWDAPALGRAQSLAWVLGQEGDGLDQRWFGLEPALRLSIPQAARLESLNVTTAAAVCFFERARQRAAAQA